MFFDPALFPFTTTLETQWRVVRDELERLETHHFEEWPEKHLYGEGWDVFGFYFLGRQFPENCQLCPETARLLATIPGLKSAGFSVLQPGTTIAPHVGYSPALLVCHLAVIVPDECALRVGNEQRQWEPGKCLVFNDMVEHEAWNRSSSRRVVLLIEFARPGAKLGELRMSGELSEFHKTLK
jgi:ornithine lipid ester-linked acyl 2-hydroxylase